MIVINFDIKPQVLKGHILNAGANIIEDDSITLEDRSEVIGIGSNDLNHYRDIAEFFKIPHIFIDENDLNYKALKECYTKRKTLLEMIKREGSAKAMLGNDACNCSDKDKTTHACRSDNIIKLSEMANQRLEAIKHYDSKVERKTLTKEQIKEIEIKYKTINSYEYRFKIRDVVDLCYNSLSTKKIQLLPYEYYVIKKELGLNV